MAVRHHRLRPGPTVGAPPPAPRERVLRIEDLYRNIEYEPHMGQRKFHAAAATHRFCVVCAGRRWGKSKAGPHEMLASMVMKKPTLGWIVAPTYDLGEKEFRVFWEVLIDRLKVPVERTKTFYNIRTKDFRITTAWGSSVEVRSAEHPESLVGEGLDWVIMAEAAKLKLSHWEKYIRPTLSDKRGRAVFVSTPEGYNWFYNLYQQGTQREHPQWWAMRSPTWENTVMFPEGENDPEMVEVRSTLALEIFDQEYGAMFTSFAGRIYSEFDEGYHVLKTYEFHPEWRNYLAFDFGFRVPFACLNVQVDPEDNVYVWDEYYEKNIHATEHARRLKSHIQWRVDGGYHDPSGAEPIAAITQIFRDTKEYYNSNLAKFSSIGADNDWRMGVGRVKEWLKLRDIPGSPTPKPKLFVSQSCRNTIREFNTYRVKEQTEKMADKMDPKEEPRKKDDHAVDAIRYFITGHFGLETHFAYQA